MPQFGVASTQGLISWAWLFCLPNSHWRGARLQSGGSQPLLPLSPAGKQQSRSQPRQGLVTGLLPPPGARGTWRGKGRQPPLTPSSPFSTPACPGASATISTYVSEELGVLSLRSKD